MSRRHMEWPPFLALALALSLALPGSPRAEPVVAGWIERVSLPEHNLTFEAKLDTGADTSSVNARNIRIDPGRGRPRVRFDLTDDAGRTVLVETALVRQVRIRRAGAPTESRPVVQLRVCVAGQTVDTEFTVADRGGLNTQMLIGRSLMAGRLLIDPARERIVSDRCGRRAS